MKLKLYYIHSLKIVEIEQGTYICHLLSTAEGSVICKELHLSETFYNLYFKSMILINIIFTLPAVYNDVEGRINAFRTMLQTKLLELPTPLEEQKKLIRSGLYLIISLMFLAQTQCHFWSHHSYLLFQFS